MNRLASFALLALAVALPARAEIEIVTLDLPQGRAERWWPKVTVPKGWRHDRDHSINYNFNALAPEAESFSSAETVMYAKAIRKATDANVTTVQQLMERERTSFLGRTPLYNVNAGRPLVSRDGQRMITVNYLPKVDGNWERVAYGEEGDYWLLFVLSARSKKAYNKANAAFERMVWQYRALP